MGKTGLGSYGFNKMVKKIRIFSICIQGIVRYVLPAYHSIPPFPVYESAPASRGVCAMGCLHVRRRAEPGRESVRDCIDPCSSAKLSDRNSRPVV